MLKCRGKLASKGAEQPGWRAGGGAKEKGNRGGGCCCSPHRAVTGLSSDSELETKELILSSWSSPGSWLL